MRDGLPSPCIPEHIGLAYEIWAPFQKDGKIEDSRRTAWLDDCAALSVSPDYEHAFSRWKKSFDGPGHRVFELALASRLLLGHGNSSATDVGLTVHHTWGVPLIPGSALKGLCAHYVDAVYGPEDSTKAPWEQAGREEERTAYQGVLWKNRRIQRGPGRVYRHLFGAPDAEEDEVLREHQLPASAAKGLVCFHDALYVPRSAPENQPYCGDGLTVHQKSYYDERGKHWPNDFESPNPISFLTVRPGVRFLFALTGRDDWIELAGQFLRDALDSWGVGGKTSAGYGRLVSPEEALGGQGDRGRATGAAARRPKPRHEKGDRITVERIEDPKGRGKIKFLAEDGIVGHFVGEDPPQVEIGNKVEVWVANICGQSYTLTLRQPKLKRR